MKTVRRLLTWTAAGALALAMSPAALGAATPATKEEVVYINLNAAGGADTVDVVNIFDLPRAGEIVDHGAYASVRNMTGTEPLSFDGEEVRVNAGPGRLYYEGRLPDAEIPWEFTLRYFLDGKELSAAELAGASGALEIRMTVRENHRCAGDFFDTYALQASFTLDGDRCADIRADGATAANVGSDKQLTYTILPGRGADISITARVTDFEMDAAAINGVPLSLDVEVDDGALLGKVTELTDAVKALDEGAGELSGGVGELQSGADALSAGTGSVSSGAGELSSGAAALQSGAKSLQSGASRLQSGLGSLSSQSSALTAGSAQILEGLQALQEKLTDTDLAGGDVSELTDASAAIKEGVDALAAGVRELGGSADTLVQQLQGYQSLADALYGAAAALMLAGTPAEGMEDAWNAAAGSLSELNGQKSGLSLMNSAILMRLGSLSSLVEGAETLQTGYEQFDQQIQGLAGLLAAPGEMLGQLKEAVDELAAGAGTLNDGLKSYTAAVGELYDGSGALTSGAASVAGGAGELSSGAAALQSGAEALGSGAAELSEGVSALDSGAAELAEGTASMREQTDGMDTKIQEQIDAMLSGITGGSGETVSFVSERNTAVRAVQFVIRTPTIRKTVQPTPAPAPAAETSFWEKLTALF